MKQLIDSYFNFRSPYCYLASQTMFTAFDTEHSAIRWRPLGGWDGRSPPERAKVKIPLVRQDMQRLCRYYQLDFCPPPSSTEPTLAAAASLYAEQQGLLRPYVQKVMAAEWGQGRDIGQPQLISEIYQAIGLSAEEASREMQSEQNLQTLKHNQQLAQQHGVIGVPAFVINDEVFWGQDRIEFAKMHLDELAAQQP